MQLHSIRCSCRIFVLFGIFILTRANLGRCNPITNSNFNEHIREFSLKEDNTNSTNIKTLQTEVPKRYAELSNFRPIYLKDVPDSKISSSSHSRGLISRDHPGYPLHDYEEYPQIGHGYDYHLPVSVHHDYDHHNFDAYHYGHHHEGHHHEGHHYPGSHYKHYNHALAAKAVLWPIAGIALLGAAAALVSNPILLQLGVATGKRKRRNTEEITGPDSDIDIIKWDSPIEDDQINDEVTKHKKCNRIHFQRKISKEKKNNPKRLSKNNSPEPPLDLQFDSIMNNQSDDINFIPLPIKLKNV